MQRKFFSNLILLLFLNLLVKPFWILGIDVFVQREVGPSVYGIYSAMMAFGFMFNVILDFGINHYNNREIAQTPEKVKKWFLSLGTIKLILGLAFIIFILLFGRNVLNYPPEYLKVLVGVGINQVLLSLLLFVRSNLAGLHFFQMDSVLSVLDRLLVVLVCSFLLWGKHNFGPFKIEWLILSQTFSYTLTILLAVFFLTKKTPVQFRLISFSFVRKIFKSSFPYALLSIIMIFYYKIDTVMLERMLSDGAVKAGVYAQAYKIPEAGNMFGLLFATLLYPIFSKMIVQKQSVEPLIVLAVKLLITPALLATVVVFFYSSELAELMYLEQVEETAAISPILMLTFTAVSFTYVFGTLLTSKGSLKALNLIAFLGLLINVCLNLVLIPKQGVLGSAVATVITQWVVVMLQLLVSRTQFQLSINLKLIGQLCGYALVMFALGKLFMSLAFESFSWGIIFTLMGVIIAILIRLIDVKALIELVKQKD